MIDKITFAVDSMSAMVTFYSEVLDVELNKRELFERLLYEGCRGEVELLFCPKDIAGVDARTNTIQLCFLVVDVESAYRRGLKLGGLAIGEPELVEGVLRAALRDPDGNSLELKQETSSARPKT